MVDELGLGEFDFDNFISDSSEIEIVNGNTVNGVTCQIVFVIDASNSMQGYKIGAVNESVNNIISKLKSLDRSNEISVIEFSTRLFKWTESFVHASEFKYSYVEMVDGLTDLNAALKELVSITKSGMKKEARKYVVLFSDGLFTESYEENFKQWEQNDLFPEITRIVVAFDDDLRDPQSRDFFKRFTGSGQIVPITDQETLLSALLVQ